MKMGAKHVKVHKAFLDLSRPFQPTKVYESMCKLMGLSEDAVERGLGKLFKEGKLRSEEKPAKQGKSGGGSGRGPDDFR